MTVNVHEARTNLSRLMEKAHRGEEIILAKAGKPYARLMPLDEVRERTPGRYGDPLPDDLLEALPHEELKAWE